MYNLYPVFVDISGRRVVIAGGGKVALRKAKTLLDANAKITLISPEITPELRKLLSNGQIEWKDRQYQNGDLKDAWLVIAACNNTRINQLIFEEATQRHIFCNVVDKPELCSFQVPALIQKQKLQIAISTAGQGPILAKKLRNRLETIVSDTYGEFLEKLAAIRSKLKEKYPHNQTKRAELLNLLIDEQILDLLEKQQTEKMETLWNHKLQQLHLTDTTDANDTNDLGHSSCNQARIKN